MKAIILIELDEKHLMKQTNDLFDRLKGYKCDLRTLPEKKDLGYPNDDYDIGFTDGWDACIDEITGDKE